MNKGFQIGLFLTYLLYGFSSFGTVVPDRPQNADVSETSFSCDSNSAIESCSITADHSQDPFSSSPFSNKLGIELQSDEEDVSKKDFAQPVHINRERLIYHAKAPPLQLVFLSVSLIYHVPLFILFEVFRL